MTHCPIHPEEVRVPRFAYLDLLIDRGWGSVPQPVIARLFRENGGKLPKHLPTGYWGADAEPEDDPVTTHADLVLEAIRNGHDTGPAIAQATELKRKRVYDVIRNMRRDGLIEECGYAQRPKHGGVTPAKYSAVSGVISKTARGKKWDNRGDRSDKCSQHLPDPSNPPMEVGAMQSPYSTHISSGLATSQAQR